ncbi:MAG: hypothetical protein GC201_18395 [Alphaproteobacteria bacterium]|nr:hypothetical protein [Alphaproteobacteria bacterium]
MRKNFALSAAVLVVMWHAAAMAESSESQELTDYTTSHTASARSLNPGRTPKKICLVKKLKYINKGGYLAHLSIETDHGTELRFGEKIPSDQSRTVDLNHKDGVYDGNEVWLVVWMDGSNETQGCRKDDTLLKVDLTNGNTWEYWSKGSTKDGNRCHFGNNTCIAPN